jgi:hypothetical protein
MKIPNCKTKHFLGMKRLTMYLWAIILLCFLNVVALKAQYSVSENTLTVNEPVITREIEPEPETKITLWQIIQSQNRLYQTVSNVFKMRSDVDNSIIRNTK